MLLSHRATGGSDGGELLRQLTIKLTLVKEGVPIQSSRDPGCGYLPSIGCKCGMLGLRFILVYQEPVLEKIKVKENSQRCFEILKVDQKYYIEPAGDIRKHHLRLDYRLWRRTRFEREKIKEEK